MKNLLKVFGVIAFTVIIGFSLTACPDGNTSSSKPTVSNVTVSAAGNAASVAKGSTLQFSATVTGTNSPAQTVTWTIDTTGVAAGTTISASGLLTVAAGETQTSLTIKATSTVDTSKSGTATVTIAASATVTSVTVSAAGNAASVAKGSTLQFSAAVTGTNSPAQTVTWTIDTAGKHSGTTINASGLLTVAAGETQTSLTIKATSTVDTSKSGTATVTVSGETATVSTVTVSAEGNAASVAKGETLQFSVAVTGTNSPAQTVTWSIDTTGLATGTHIDTHGLLTVALAETNTSIVVKATSSVDNTKSGTLSVNVITLENPPTVTSVTVNPSAPSVSTGSTQEFTATVTGTNDPAQTVIWSIDTAGKHASTTIDEDGLLTVAAGETLTSLVVRATSSIDPTKSGTATVTITITAEQGFEFGIISGGSIITGVAQNSETKVITVTANTTYTGYKWYIGNTLQAETGNVLTINSQAALAAGIHTVTVEAKKDEMDYATTIFYKIN